MAGFKNITGVKKGRLTAKKRTGKLSSNGDSIWVFLCDCGNFVSTTIGRFNYGKTISCGCAIKDQGERREDYHGMKNSPEYKSWCKIKERCYNPRCQDYVDYGAKGIFMSDEWKTSFKKFFEDIGERPSENSTIDRIDRNKGYCKENCRWASGFIQSRNQGTVKGRKYKCVQYEKSTGKWIAVMTLGSLKSKKIGRYENEDHAAAAVNLALKLVFGENCDYVFYNDTPFGDEVVNTDCKFFKELIPLFIKEREKLYVEYER